MQDQSTSNGLFEYQTKKHIDFQIQTLTTYLKSLQNFDQKLEFFKRNFYSIFSSRLPEEIENLLKELQIIQEHSEKIVKVNLINPSLLEALNQTKDYLQNLNNNSSLLSKNCYDLYVIPLVDNFWNFKNQVDNSLTELKYPTPIANGVKKTNEQDNVIITHYKFNENRIKQLQHVVLKKFQGPKENKVPSLNQALRRAAGYGTPEDLADLLSYGAALNSFDDQKKLTALHHAVIQKKVSNVQFLLTRYPNIKLEDANNKTAGDYASESDDIIIRTIFHDHSHQIFKGKDLLKLILANMSVDDLHWARSVNSFWKQSFRSLITDKLKAANVKEAEITKFFNLPDFLQYTIIKVLIEKQLSHEVSQLIPQLTITSNAEKKNNSSESDNAKNIEITCKVLNILTVDEWNKHRWKINNYALIMLVEGLISPKQLELFTHSSGTHDNFANLACENGLKALRKKLLTPKGAPYISNLRSLLSDNGLKALEAGLITENQARQIYHSGSTHGPFDQMATLMSDDGFTALKEGLITPEQLAYIDHSFNRNVFSKEAIMLKQKGILSFEAYPGNKIRNADCLINAIPDIASKNGQLAIAEGLLNIDQISKIKNTRPLFTDIGIKALKEGLITAEQVPTLNNLHIILSENGIIALSKGLLTLDQMSKIPDLAHVFSTEGMNALKTGILNGEHISKITDLKNLFLKDCIKALKEGVITIEQAQQAKSLWIFSQPNGFRALKEKLITLEQLSKFHGYGTNSYPPKSLTTLLSDVGLNALKEGLITPEDAALFYQSSHISGNQDNLHILLNKIGIIALRKKLISPKEAPFIVELDRLLREDNPDIIKAMELGVIKPDDFKYQGKYSSWSLTGRQANILPEFTKNLISSYKPSYDFKNDNVKKSCEIVQKQWRGVMARKQFSLFKELKTCMQSGNIHTLDELVNIKQLTEKGRLTEASTRLGNLKKIGK